MQRYILFFIVLLCGSFAEAQSNFRYEYWFDRNYAARASVDFSSDTVSANFDVEHLDIGFHTLNFHLKDSAEWTTPTSFTFFRVPSLEEKDPTSQPTYTYWFDNHRAETLQTDALGNGMLLINVASLETGLHRLNVMVAIGVISTPPQSYTFFKVDSTISAGALAYRYWFDNDYDTVQTSDFINGLFLLPTDSLKAGLHRLNIMVDKGNTSTPPQSYTFFKVDSTDTIGALVYSYWFNNDPTHKTSGELQNGIVMLETDSLPVGFHHVTIQMEGTGATFAKRALFYKEPDGGLGISKYEYWVNDAYVEHTIAEVNPPKSHYILDTLLPMDTTAFDAMSFVFQPRTPYPVVYSKNEVHFRFWNNMDAWVDASKTYVDERVYRDVIADTIERNTTEQIVTPTGDSIHWFVLNADVSDSLAFRSDYGCMLALYAPSGIKTMSASGDSATAWTGLRATERGVYHLAVLKGASDYANLNVSYYYESPAADTVLSVSICEGTAYTDNGFNESESGIYTQRIETAQGRDSIVQLILTVNPTVETVLYDTICQGVDYAGYGFTVTNAQASDTLTQELATVHGCDSTVTLILTVNPTKETVLYDTVCKGRDYASYGFSLTNAQANDTLMQELATVHGCDSTVTLYLTVMSTAETVLYDTICQSSDYADFGFSVTNAQESDTLVQELSTVNGCDSTVTLLLTVMPIYNIVLEDTVARGESYSNYGFALTDLQESGTYTQELTTLYGCDSIVTLHLTVQTVGIETIANGEEIAVVLYPNPADERVTLQVQALPSDAEVTIYDAQGRTVLSQTLKAGEETLTLNIGSLAAGNYHVLIVSNDKATVRKLIIQ